MARRWPALAAPLSTTRRELIRADSPAQGFLAALFFLVRAPERMPAALWSAHERRLRRAMRILTAFPRTAAEVERAVRKLERIVPREERRAAIPTFPHLGLRRSGRCMLKKSSAMLSQLGFKLVRTA